MQDSKKDYVPEKTRTLSCQWPLTYLSVCILSNSPIFIVSSRYPSNRYAHNFTAYELLRYIKVMQRKHKYQTTGLWARGAIEGRCQLPGSPASTFPPDRAPGYMLPMVRVLDPTKKVAAVKRAY